MVNNFLNNLPEAKENEVIEILQSSSDFRIERITSFGQCSPQGFWYQQKENEWVILLKGEAKLRFAENDEIINLKINDFVYIPAYKKHRVEYTTEDEETIWLAVFWI